MRKIRHPPELSVTRKVNNIKLREANRNIQEIHISGSPSIFDFNLQSEFIDIGNS